MGARVGHAFSIERSERRRHGGHDARETTRARCGRGRLVRETVCLRGERGTEDIVNLHDDSSPLFRANESSMNGSDLTCLFDDSSTIVWSRCHFFLTEWHVRVGSSVQWGCRCVSFIKLLVTSPQGHRALGGASLRQISATRGRVTTRDPSSSRGAA